MQRRQTSLYLIVIGAFLLLISGSFLTEGLPGVGRDNAVVSQRMSEGFEKFWLPSLDTPGNPDRSNYLPLGYWLESKWFSLFQADSFLVEKCYSVLIFIVLGLLIMWIWCLSAGSRRTGWLPLMCWLSIPLVSWSATSNLLEGTMSIFILLSVAFMLKGSKAASVASKRKAVGRSAGSYGVTRMTWFVLAAVMMELAFLVKGFAGLFPVVFPLLYWLLVRREKIMNAIRETSIIVIVWFVTLGFVVLFSHEVYNHLYNYLHHQLIGGVLHVRTVASHFYILYAFAKQAVIPVSIIVLVSLIRIRKRPVYRYLFFWRHKNKLTADQMERARFGWFYVALGLSGVIPIMMGLKQQEFYLVPTLPFFAIAMACLLHELLIDLIDMMNDLSHKVITALAILFFGVGVVLNMASIHKVTSNQVLLNDMKVILPYLEHGECITVPPEILESTEVGDFFYRYKGITFDTVWTGNHLLIHYGRPQGVPAGMEARKLELPTSQYSLWELVALKTDDLLKYDTVLSMDNKQSDEKNNNDL